MRKEKNMRQKIITLMKLCDFEEHLIREEKSANTIAKYMRFACKYYNFPTKSNTNAALCFAAALSKDG